MAMGRPPKKIDSKMRSLAQDLGSEHMPDEWHELFDLYNELEQYPKLTKIIERQIETLFNERLKRVPTRLKVKRSKQNVQALATKKEKRHEKALEEGNLVLAKRIADREVSKHRHIKGVVTVDFNEAHFILEVALKMAHKSIRGKHLDHPFDAKEIAAKAIEKILTAGSYDPTSSRGEKLNYIQLAIQSARNDRYNEKLRHGSSEEDQDEAENPRVKNRKRKV